MAEAFAENWVALAGLFFGLLCGRAGYVFGIKMRNKHRGNDERYPFLV
ncbi:hypothetical protein [Metabacillus sp. 84]